MNPAHVSRGELLLKLHRGCRRGIWRSRRLRHECHNVITRSGNTRAETSTAILLAWRSGGLPVNAILRMKLRGWKTLDPV